MPYSSTMLERRMRKILSIIKREYVQIVRTKGFIIGTILGPILMASFIIVPIAIQFVSVDRQERIGVIDLSEEVFLGLDKRLDQRLKDNTRRYLFEEYKGLTDIEKLREELNNKVLRKELEAYIFIPKDISEGGEAEYVSEHVSDLEKRGNIGQALSSIIIEKRLKGEGLDPQKIGEYMQPVPLEIKKVTKKGVEKDTGQTFIYSYLLVLILYMTVIFYGQIILRGVIEEKSSRVVEIMLSSLRPFQLMAGKVLGIALVGFTQYAIWALFGLGASRYGKRVMVGFITDAKNFDFQFNIPPYIFIFFVVFFILGYFLYGTVYAAIGSMVNSEKEAQNLVMPVTMLLVIPLLLIVFIMKNPESSVSVTLSMIPFFAPVLMLLRVCILLPPIEQLAGSILILILTILFMIWVSSKIYRVGILMYGKRPNLKEILKWMRYG